MKTLLLMRHAKSDWSNPALSDADRPLNKRGKKAAVLMGQWLTDHHYLPNYVICSTAQRTRETLGRIRLSAEIAGKDIKYEKKLYQATLPTLLQTLENSPWQKGTIMLLGHNPEMESLLNYLCDGNIKPSKTGKLFPTGSIAVIHLAGEITESSGNLIDIARPKEL